MLLLAKPLIFVPVAFGLPLGAAVSAQQGGIEVKSPEIGQRGPDGRAQVVRFEGKEYQVCVGERQDESIPPRAAGLDWGDRPLKYWPTDRDNEKKGDRQSSK